MHGHQNCGGQRLGAWETLTSLLVTETGCKNLHKLLRMAVGCKDVCRHLATVAGCKNLHELSRTAIGCKDVHRHSEISMNSQGQQLDVEMSVDFNYLITLTGFKNLHKLSRTAKDVKTRTWLQRLGGISATAMWNCWGAGTSVWSTCEGTAITTKIKHTHTHTQTTRKNRSAAFEVLYRSMRTVLIQCMC